MDFLQYKDCLVLKIKIEVVKNDNQGIFFFAHGQSRVYTTVKCKKQYKVQNPTCKPCEFEKLLGGPLGELLGLLLT